MNPTRRKIAGTIAGMLAAPAVSLAQPVGRMEFGLAVNLRTARMLGITVPQSLLLRAN